MKITTKFFTEKRKTSPLNKVIISLFAILVTTFVFAVSLKTLQGIGIILGIIINGLISYLGINNSEKKSILKLLSITILSTTIIEIILGITITILLKITVSQVIN